MRVCDADGYDKEWRIGILTKKETLVTETLEIELKYTRTMKDHYSKKEMRVSRTMSIVPYRFNQMKMLVKKTSSWTTSH